MRRTVYKDPRDRATGMRVCAHPECVDLKTELNEYMGDVVITDRETASVDHDADAEMVILGHAVRIARYLYPNAYLSSASAVLLGPAPDGRLFISGRRNQRTRLRTLEIIQNEAPSNPSNQVCSSAFRSGTATLASPP